MVVSGKDNPRQAGPDEVAQRTIQCLKRTVPAAVPGIAFPVRWSKRGERDRALECHEQVGSTALASEFFLRSRSTRSSAQAWKGEAANVAAAQKIFYHRAKMNSAARSGSYTKQTGRGRVVS